MSFNEIAQFRIALSDISKRYPGRLKAGHRSVMWVILSYPDGCFIGQDELADQSGLSVDTVKAYLRTLSNYGYILREQKYARKGLRQCYRINVPAMTSIDRVLPDTRYEATSPVLSGTESVKGRTGAPNECDPIPAYRYTNKDKYDRAKTDRFSFGAKTDRFNDFIKLLPAHLQGVGRGDNVDAYLDALDAKGVALQATADYVSDYNYNSADKPYGVAVKRLCAFSEATPVRSLIELSRKRVENENRLQDEQRSKAEAEKATPEQATARAEQARAEMARNKD